MKKVFIYWPARLGVASRKLGSSVKSSTNWFRNFNRGSLEAFLEVKFKVDLELCCFSEGKKKSSGSNGVLDKDEKDE